MESRGRQAAQQELDGEQLAYVAGIARGSRIIFGDRPKAFVLQRLFNHLSVPDLEAAFASKVVALRASGIEPFFPRRYTCCARQASEVVP